MHEPFLGLGQCFKLAIRTTCPIWEPGLGHVAVLSGSHTEPGIPKLKPACCLSAAHIHSPSLAGALRRDALSLSILRDTLDLNALIVILFRPSRDRSYFRPRTLAAGTDVLLVLHST